MSKRGFTFIEVIVTLVILGIAFVALAQLNITNLVLTGRGDTLTTASLLAEQKMNAILAQGYPDLKSEKGIDPKSQLEWTYNVTEVDVASTDVFNTDEMEPLRQIDVVVTWLQGDHKKEYVLSTSVANRW